MQNYGMLLAPHINKEDNLIIVDTRGSLYHSLEEKSLFGPSK
ncbi:hypothetical protein ACI2OX_11750 [Bacillus sp. N9]